MTSVILSKVNTTGKKISRKFYALLQCLATGSKWQNINQKYFLLKLKSESEFNEFEPRLKSAKKRFQLSACFNLETLNTILSETKHI